MQKKYVAVKRGFDGMTTREVGEEFMFAGPQGKWMKLVEPEAEVKEAKPAKGKAEKQAE